MALVRLFYLATPYTLYPGGLDEACRVACVNAAMLLRAGIAVFSPISHAHPIATLGGIPARDLEFWMMADRPLMAVCGGLIVLKADGWGSSKGIRREIGIFRRAGKPVIWMKPGEIPAELTMEAA